MCGIAGVVSFDGNPARIVEPRLYAMGSALVHRGPDGGGVFVDTTSHQVALVHRRLSIIDLAGGRQPISNEDGTVHAVVNGEIFNYIELRRTLVSRGHRFRTSTDTEVIVHLYEDLGDDFVHELNGQFAIALWDTKQRRLLLVRDRPGILPLYYRLSSQELLFASEIKSILAAIPAPPTVHPDALRDVMTLWAPLGPTTMFEGVLEVEPGHLLSVRDGRVAVRKYWTWTLSPASEVRRGNERRDVETLRGLLEDATHLRLRADVRVSALLSGGLDSSLLVDIAARATGGALRTYSIGFDDAALDERPYQRLVAERAGVELRRVCCGAGELTARFMDVIRAAEVPVTRTSPVPMHLIASAMRAAGETVVLSGEGADEVFGGYDLFKEAKIRAFAARRPSSPRRARLLARLYPYLTFTRDQPPALLAQSFGAATDPASDAAFSHRPRWAAGPSVEGFLQPSFRERCSTETPAERAVDAFGPSLEPLGPFHRAQLLEARLLMPGYLLSSQSDRMLMAHGLEARLPYLDHRVIEFANQLDPRVKMRVLDEKHILKQAASGLVPAEVLARPKQPYRGPDAAVFLGEKPPDIVSDLLDPAVLHQYGYFEPVRVRTLLRKLRMAATEHRPVSHRDSLAFVTILSTQAWHHLFQTSPGDRPC